MEKIKMVDLYGQYSRIKTEIDEAINKVITSSAFIQGPQVSSFARALATFTGAKEVVPCANGTDALQISMMALGLKDGDEVIVPVHTYVATAEVIALLKLTPVFTDVDERTFNIDMNQVEKKITVRTKAIVPVHLYGQCADMEAVMGLAKKHDLFVIEDAAQAMGATYIFRDNTEKSAGTIGTIGTTSFFPSKNLGCFGDGGAIFTDDPELSERMRMIANHGQKRKYHHDCIGMNSRLDTIQAAILEVKLKYLKEYTAKRNEVAAGYDNQLNGLDGVSIPVRSATSTHVFHQYTLRVNKRDQLKEFLERKGIPTMIYYPVPLHLQQAYKRSGFGEGSFPVAERLSGAVISLPIHTEMGEESVDYICGMIKEFYS